MQDEVKQIDANFLLSDLPKELRELLDISFELGKLSQLEISVMGTRLGPNYEVRAAKNLKKFEAIRAAKKEIEPRFCFLRKKWLGY